MSVAKGRKLPGAAAFAEKMAGLALPGLRELAQHAAVFLFGLLYARGIVFSRCAPFGTAAVAACPYRFLPAMVLGALVGTLLPGQAQSPVRYLAAILAAAAIRWTVNDLAKLRSHPAFAPLAALLPLVSTGLAMAFVDGSPVSTIAVYLAESVLGAGAAYFAAQAEGSVRRAATGKSLTGQEAAGLTLVGGLLLLPLAGLTIGGVSVGRILACLLILLAARCAGAAGGAVAGITAGVLFSLSTTGLTYLSGAYALGGLMAGLFSPLGRAVSAIVFMASSGVASLQVGNQTAVLTGLLESAAAGAVYLILPAKLGGTIAGLFLRREDMTKSDALRRTVIMKLDYAAKALGGVSESVEEVSRKLAFTCAPDINGVYKRLEREVCAGCSLQMYCWGQHYGRTIDALQTLTPVLRRDGHAVRQDLPDHFSSHCARVGELILAVNRNYSEFTVREAAEQRLAQIRSLVAGQFGTVSRMLEDMAGELELYERFDFAAARRVTESLRAMGLLPLDVSCRVDRFGRMTVEAEAARGEKSRLSRSEICREVSRACGKPFELPCVSTAQGKCRIQMSEKPVYRVAAGFSQHICGNGTLCGDSYEYFSDGFGRQAAVLSDGMGSGGRAAVDGAMASGILSRLLQAGIGPEAALQIVNSALIAKSGDESLATLDVVLLDRFSGAANFYKAGAAVSVVRHKGRASLVDAPSLPVGILNETSFARRDDVLGDGDLIVLMSDGAVAAGDDWILKAVEEYGGGLPQELAEELVSGAIARRSDGHDDDVTVLVLQLKAPERPLDCECA